ncbi:hypothetical protein HOY80DRAFT_1027762 [Tuber brumale]|nr:hypothetical protein HOY80DRAFT_1027762 [Tuber brumale]
MNGNTSRAISRFSRPSASALRSSPSVIDVDFPLQQDEQEGNLFANDDATDIDEDSDETPQRHRRVQKRSVEDYTQHQKEQRGCDFHENGYQTAEEDNSASDIADTVTSLSDPSNFMQGEGRIVFENAANMVQYHTWFVNPFVKPSASHSLLESYWVKAASKLGCPGLAMQKHAMTFLKSRQSSARSHLVSETRITVQNFYDLLHKQPAEIRAKVSYLREADRFMCHPSKQENCSFRFGTPEIVKLLYHKWFHNVKMRGLTDKSFLGRINGVLICLTAAGIYQALKAWSTGTFVQPSDFPALTAKVALTLSREEIGRCEAIQKKLVEDTKKRIKRLLRDNRFVPEHESRAALEDLDAVEYLWVPVSGDEDSDIGDNNSDQEVEDVIDALVEGPEQDE